MSKEINKELLDEESYEGYEDQVLYNKWWKEANKVKYKNEQEKPVEK